MSAILDIVGERLPHIRDECPVYWASLSAACREYPPPYGEQWYGETFRRNAMDLDWLVGIIALNSRKEADGARQLWAFADSIEDTGIRVQVRDHAMDEARHAAFYIAMLDLMFPGEFSTDELSALKAQVPHFPRDEDTVDVARAASFERIVDEVVQMNIGEIRTLINQMLMRPFVDVLSPQDTRARALKLIDGLGDDEAVHIEYTARVIESLNAPELVRHFMRTRLAEFNEITRREIGTRAGLEEMYT